MDKLIEELNNSKAKITFGLTPHNIEVIEKELERFGGRDFDAKYNRYIWDKLGKELSWEPLTLCLYYFEYLEQSGAAGKKIKVSSHQPDLQGANSGQLQQHNVMESVCAKCGGTGIVKGGPTDSRKDEPCTCKQTAP